MQAVLELTTLKRPFLEHPRRRRQALSDSALEWSHANNNLVLQYGKVIVCQATHCQLAAMNGVESRVTNIPELVLASSGGKKAYYYSSRSSTSLPSNRLLLSSTKVT